MNFNCFLPLWIIGIFLLPCIKCESFLTEAYNIIYNIFHDIPCRYMECCVDDYINTDVTNLDNLLEEHLYGQQIAHNIVVNALRGHISSSNPPKALVMSFHGSPGTGKTYVAQMIAKMLYKKGTGSRYYHFFSGRNDFPLDKKVDEYKEELRKTIVNSLANCERSMFVFDEVDKMPEGLLDVLVPFLDYNTWDKSWRDQTAHKQKAIYIFLSNTGSTRIVQRLLNLWEEGRQRHTTKLQDFENLVSIGAFNEKGGLHHSDTIDTNVIDHYVPFLPLEEVHVKKCLIAAFLERNFKPTDEMIEEVLSYVTFGPEPHNIYANAGCKRLQQKVAATIYNKRKKTEF